MDNESTVTFDEKHDYIYVVPTNNEKKYPTLFKKGRKKKKKKHFIQILQNEEVY
jgi:hypothetical protein